MSDQELLRQFGEFGKCMFYIGVLLILCCIPFIQFVAIIIQLIFIIKALNLIKIINSKMQHPDLVEFRSKAITGMLISVISGIIFSFIFLGLLYRTSMNANFFLIVAFTILFMIILTIAANFNKKAWISMHHFLETYSNMFPNKISKEAIDGSDYLKRGFFYFMLWLLIIPPIIGFIFQIIGYFKVGKLRYLKYGDAAEGQSNIGAPAPTAPAADLLSSVEAKFCPACGAKIEPGIRFCGKCGTQI